MENRRTILVTGGCGFIGTNFIRLLRKSYGQWRVVNLDKLTYAGNPKNLNDIREDDGYRLVVGDICDEKLVSEIFTAEKIDTVVNFAAESHVDRSITGPADFIRTNIIGTFTLLEAARISWLDQNGDLRENGNTCFIHISTDEVYGSLGRSGYFTEKTPFDPRSPYSASKASSDHLVNAYFHTYGLPVRLTNCSNNYGPYQFPEKLIPLVLSNGIHGKSLPVYGDGRNIRDWLYVTDHCQAIIEVLLKGQDGQSYNIGGNNEKENIEVVSAICDILDEKLGRLESGQPRRSLITFVKDRLGHDRRYAIDAKKIKEKIGWEPQVTFEKGLRKTVEWYLDHQQWVADIVDGSYKY